MDQMTLEIPIILYNYNESIKICDRLTHVLFQIQAVLIWSQLCGLIGLENAGLQPLNRTYAFPDITLAGPTTINANFWKKR